MPFSDNNEYVRFQMNKIRMQDSKKKLYSGCQESRTEIQNEPKQTSSKDGYADALTRAEERRLFKHNEG